jgi:hypothetical protein
VAQAGVVRPADLIALRRHGNLLKKSRALWEIDREGLALRSRSLRSSVRAVRLAKPRIWIAPVMTVELDRQKPLGLAPALRRSVAG